MAVEFFVEGRPVSQGSKRIGRARGGAPIVIDDSPKLKAWRRLVALGARAAWLQPAAEYPLRVELVFAYERPRSHMLKSGRLASGVPQLPERELDIDKTERAVFDAITGPIVDDDSRIVQARTEKVYVRGQGGVFVSVELAQPHMRLPLRLGARYGEHGDLEWAP